MVDGGVVVVPVASVLRFQELIVAIRKELVQFVVGHLQFLPYSLHSGLERKGELRGIDAVVLDDLVELAVPHNDVDVEVAHLGHLDRLANHSTHSLALVVLPLVLIRDPVQAFFL